MLTNLSVEGCIIPVDIYVMLSNCCSYCLRVFNMVRRVWKVGVDEIDCGCLWVRPELLTGLSHKSSIPGNKQWF